MLRKKSEFIQILKQDWCFSYGFISLYDVKNICAEFFEADYDKCHGYTCENHIYQYLYLLIYML